MAIVDLSEQAIDVVLIIWPEVGVSRVHLAGERHGMRARTYRGITPLRGVEPGEMSTYVHKRGDRPRPSKKPMLKLPGPAKATYVPT